MKCSIPSFVTDFVSVIGWTTSDDELTSFTQESSKGKEFAIEKQDNETLSQVLLKGTMA